jgi:hypothetical protein
MTLAVMQALLGFTSEPRWLRHARAHLWHFFPYPLMPPGYNKRLQASAALVMVVIRVLATDTSLWADDVRVVDPTPVECGRSRETVKRPSLAGWTQYGYCAAREGIAHRFLPECAFGGRDKRKLRFAVLPVAALHGGAELDLFGEVVSADDDFLAVRLVRNDCLYPRRRPGGCARVPGMLGAAPACIAPRSVSLPRLPDVSGANDIGGAKRGANGGRCRATPGHPQPPPVRLNCTSSHIQRHRATLGECLLSRRSSVRIARSAARD